MVDVKMATISHVVEKLMNDNSFLEMTVEKEIASFTALAKYLRPDIEKELHKKVKPSAIIMALRRYAEKLEKKEGNFTSYYFRNIILKTDVCYFVIDSSPDTLDKLQNMYSTLDFKQGDIFNIVQGNHETSIITNIKYEDNIVDVIGQEKIKKLVNDHISISLLYAKDYSLTPGVFYNILRNIAWENINILTFFTTPSELIIFLHHNDAMKCYNILEKYLKKNSNNSIPKYNILMQ
jgi:aspartokinase